MNTFVTVVHVLLTLFATGAGTVKLILPYTRFSRIPFQEWSQDFTPGQVRVIGVLELVGAIGLLTSLLVPTLSPLTPFAALGVALLMSGAIATHLRRSEYLNLAGNSVWLTLSLFLAYSKLGLG